MGDDTGGKILYYSTNYRAPKVSFGEAVLRGLAPDRGLYMPERFPKVDAAEIEEMQGKGYAEIAFAIARKFLQGEIPDDKLRGLVEDAYDFEVPVEKIEDGKYIARLDRGPTASFKDFAARVLARVMNHFLVEEDRNVVILTATSGDTGGAVADAFCGLGNVKVVVLFPEREVSERQRKQMTTLGGNVSAIAVDGKFDDCQAMVKQAFADPELHALGLSSANSINFGRLMPQAVYYFYVHSRVAEAGKGEKVVFSVPSGNFGNLVGGIIASRMGLPVERFIAATNANDEFPRFLETGKYEKIVPSRKCISNAMNVGHPSNLARVIAAYGGWMDENGRINKMPDMERLRTEVFSVSISDTETRKAIKAAYVKHKTVLEPHGAVGWAALERFLCQCKIQSKAVSLETADPAKFPEEIEKILGFAPEMPESLKRIEGKKENYLGMAKDQNAFKEFLKEL